MQKRILGTTLIVLLIFTMFVLVSYCSSTFYNQQQGQNANAATVTQQNKDSRIVEPMATINFPFPFATPTPTPSPTPIPTPTPVPTPKPILFTPQMEVSYRTSSVDNRLRVEIYGTVKTNTSAPIVNAPLLVDFSSNGNEWESLSLVQTQSDGAFTAVWIPPSPGNYTLRVTIDETSAYYSANKTVDCVLTEESEQQPIVSESTPWTLYFELIVAAFVALAVVVVAVKRYRAIALKKKYEIKH